VDVAVDGPSFILRCASEYEICADVVVLAISSDSPDSQLHPEISSAARQLIIWNPWEEAAYERIARDDDVLIVGAGLTMADIVASLDRRGHRGNIAVVSRHGFRPQTQSQSRVEPFGDFLLPPSRRARSLLARIRRAVSLAESLGLTWHGVVDQVHDHGNQIWQFLPWEERKRLMRHAWSYWKCFRFRITPQLAEVLNRKMLVGQLSMRAGSVQHIGSDERGVLHVRMRKRGETADEMFAGHVVMATGPKLGYLLNHDVLVRNICGKGLARPDPIGVGLDIDLTGNAIDRFGNVQERLFVVGTLTQGRFGDQVGAPEIASHALRVAAEIVNGLFERHRHRHRRSSERERLDP
jgi:uncharacterized NAD(P)/FAD-binding protein YdhS